MDSVEILSLNQMKIVSGNEKVGVKITFPKIIFGVNKIDCETDLCTYSQFTILNALMYCKRSAISAWSPDW